MALGSVLAGSDRPLIVTSGTAIAKVPPGEPATEDAPAITSNEFPRAASEEATAAAAATHGVSASVVRLPQVHDPERQGLISPWIAIAREKGVIAYIGEGRNRWPAAHISDVARLYRLAIEKSEPGAIYNAVGEEGVRARNIAETIGRRLKLPVKSITPEEAGGYFGWLAHLAARDMPASSELTQKEAGMAADRAGVDRRSRTLAGLLELKPTRDHRRRRRGGRRPSRPRLSWRCWRCALERRCYGKPSFRHERREKRWVAVARPTATINVALRPPAFPGAPCDNQGNQVPRSRPASSPRSRAPARAFRRTRRRCLSWGWYRSRQCRPYR